MIYHTKNGFYKKIKIVEQNRLPARSYFIPFSNRLKIDKTLPPELQKSDRQISLNGKWQIAFFPKGAPSKIDTDRLNFSSIDVPSCWQLRGFEQPAYLKDRYEFNCRPPHVPSKQPVGIYSDGVTKRRLRAFDAYNSAAVYRKTFNIRDLSKSYIITFFGVSSCFDLYINGNFVGYSQGSHNTAEFDISRYLKEVSNEIIVLVRKWCVGSYLESHNTFRLSGIFRDVFLQQNNKTHIFDFDFKTQPTDDAGSYAVNLSVNIKNPEGHNLKVSLEDGSDIVFEKVLRLTEPLAQISFEDSFKEYNAEMPHLYKLYLSLVKDNKVTECVCKNIAFKRIKIENGVFLLNGKPIKLYGVNYQDTHMKGGAHISYEDMSKDIRLMKEHNINTVRTAGYPPHPVFAALCDMFGIYLIPEAEIESSGTWYSPFFRPNLISGKRKWAAMYLDRTARLFHTFKNQASVIMWSLGSDSGGQYCQDVCYEWLKTVSDLPVQYEGVINSKRRAYDVLSLKNNNIDELPAVLEKLSKDANACGKPIFLSEYAYAVGSGRGGLKEYMQLISSDEKFLGGCVWQFADQSVRLNGKKRIGEGGYISDGWLCEDGLFSSDRVPHPSAFDLKYNYRPIVSRLVDNGTLELFNRNFFKDTAGIKIMLRIFIDGKEISRTQLDAVIPPQKSRLFDIFLGVAQGDMFLNVEYIDMDGKVVGVEQHMINESLPDTQTAEKGKLKLVDRNGILNISFQNGYMRIDKTTGNILNYVINGTEYLDADPARMGSGCFSTNILRPLTGGEPAVEDAVTVVPVSFSYRMRESGEAVEIQISNELYFDDKLSYVSQDMYVLFAGGKMEVYTTLHPRRKNLPPLKCFGKIIKMAAEFTDITYYGRGNIDNYPDAKEFAQIGIYNTSAEEFAHKYTKPQEAGNRCDTRFALLRNEKSQGLLFLALAKPFNFKARMHPKWRIDTARYQDELPNSRSVYAHIDGQVSGLSAAGRYKIPAAESYVMGFCMVPYNSASPE